ncbi:MAG TPA: hypothetical protein VLB44_14505 [Kofleriaceae bacterium]|nr:hypothetical protein [Kofleriaceae bacterium]
MKKGLRIGGMTRSFLASSTPAAQASPTDEATTVAPAPTSMARRGLALSGAGRRLGISGMNRPAFERPVPDPVTTGTDPGDDEVLP